MTTQYLVPTRSGAIIIPLADWLKQVSEGKRTARGGHGFWSKETNGVMRESSLEVFTVINPPPDATHVAWYYG